MKNTQKASRVIANQALGSLHLRFGSVSGWLKSPDAEILELKTTECGSLLHLTVKPPLLKGAFKGLQIN